MAPFLNRLCKPAKNSLSYYIVLGGFTLVELLIASSIGALILVGAATSIVSHIKSTTSQEVVRTLRDQWGMLNYFLDTEISMASCATASGSTLTLYTTFDCSGSAFITYTFDGINTLTRSGPPIQDDGTLNTAVANTPSTLSENVSAFTPDATTASRPAYTITLASRSFSFTGLSSSTRLRTSNYPLN